MKFLVNDSLKLNAAVHANAGGERSMREIKRLIESGACYLNGHIERFANRMVGAGDEVELITTMRLEPRLIYSDEALLAYDKPAGLNAVEAGGCVEIAKRDFGAIFPVHRLDRCTSGILLFARSAAAAQKIEEAFKERKIHKEYLALVHGTPAEDEFVVENRLGRLQGGGFGVTEDGQSALTRFTVLRRGKGVALVRARPKTGRTHQIRIHLSGLQLPILGDAEYGRFVKFRHRAARCMLHAERLQLPHPLTGEPLQLCAPPPDDFKAMLRAVFD